MASLVAGAGRRAFEDFLREAAGPDAPVFSPDTYATARTPRLVVRSKLAGAIQAIDSRGLVGYARAHDCVVVVPKVVGDFVPEGAVLIEVYGDRDPDVGAEEKLRSMTALGVERTIEQDPAFALRIMVDIAIRALSPAVNDPTTAVQVLDHLGDALRLIGSTRLELPDTPRRREDVVVRTRRWEDFLTLGVTEIREYGGASIQVVRRLRAMLEELQESVLAEHVPAVEDELERLDATLAEHWADSVDFDRASTADRQGIGGPGAHSPG